MKILFIGDVFGEPGRLAIKKSLPGLRQELKLDFVIANVENAAHGKGVTPRMIEELQSYGVSAFTSGNHIWDQKEIIPYISRTKLLTRPANYSPDAPGQGSLLFEVYSGVKVAVINVEGQRFMPAMNDSLFRAVDREIDRWRGQADFYFVDIHAETTSEKRMLGWYLDGRVAAVIGTHTHVQTADEEILPKGTAFLTDAGMTGPYDSVIGLQKEVAQIKMVKQMPAHFEPAKGDVRFSAVMIDVNESKGTASQIIRIQQRVSL